MVVVFFAGIFGTWLARRRHERALLDAQASELLNEPSAELPVGRVLSGTSQRSGSLLVRMAAERADEAARAAERASHNTGQSESPGAGQQDAPAATEAPEHDGADQV